MASCGPGLKSCASWPLGFMKIKESSLSLSAFLLIKTSSRFDPSFHVVLIALVGEKEAGEIVSHLTLLIGSAI